MRDAMDNPVASEIEGREIRVFPLFSSPSFLLFFSQFLSLPRVERTFFFREFRPIAISVAKGPRANDSPCVCFAPVHFTRDTRVVRSSFGIHSAV